VTLSQSTKKIEKLEQEGEEKSYYHKAQQVNEGAQHEE